MNPRFATIGLILLLFGWLGSADGALPATPPLRGDLYDPVALLGSLGFGEKLEIAGSAVQWQAVRWSRGGIALAVGKPVGVGVKGLSRDEIATAAVSVVRRLSEDLNLAECDLRCAQVLHGRGTTTALLYPYYDNAPVYASYVALTFNRRGELASVKARGFGNQRSSSFNLTPQAASDAALKAAGLVATTKVASVRRVWLPQGSGAEINLYAAYEVLCEPDNPQQRPALFVEAASGALLARENRVCYERLPGTTSGLYHPAYERDQQRVGAFRDEWVRLTAGAQGYSDSAGTFAFEVNPGAAPFRVSSELRGRWVDVNYDDGADAAQTVQVERVGPVSISWNRDNSRDDERTLYFHTNVFHAFWERLAPEFDGMDYPVPATCQYGDGYDNAFWDGWGMFFGGGERSGNFALYADVIYHEYGHGVTGHIYPWDILPYEGESGALNEAWSDYFACSLTDEPYLGEGGLGPGGYIRLLDNDLIYPRDIVGEVHYDSRIISAAMWHSRAVLGRDLTDPLFHYARYELGADFLAYFTDVLLTDDDNGDITDGTMHDTTLYEQFGRHGIGPGIHPQISITRAELFDDNANGSSGNDDQMWESGETVRIEVDLRRDGTLYPPPAEDVTITLATDYPHIQIERSSVGYGSMRVGDRRPAGRNALLFRIANDAPLSFADLRLTISAAGEPIILRDTLHIPIGRPQLLLVGDPGEGEDYTPWFEDPLDALGVVYAKLSVREAHRPLPARLPQFESVIWFTGDARDGFLSRDDQQAISQFIDGGGNFLLTGQSVGRWVGNGAFLEDSFGARVRADSLSSFYIEGLEEDPVGNGLTLLLLGARGAMNQRRPAAIAAIGDAAEFLHWTRVEGRPSAGVRYEHPDSGARTIFLSFGVEGIGGHGGTSTRSDLLAAAMDWFGVVQEAKEPSGATPARFELREPYPNPFNATTVIAYDLPSAEFVSLEVFDLAGRKVARWLEGRHAAGSHRVVWDASGVPSGLYICRLQAGAEVRMARAVLVR